MAWKQIQQRSFADDLAKDHRALQKLDGINDLIDWSRIENLLSHIHQSPCGEKAWPPLVMFKVCLLQSWYKISDLMMEELLVRDLLYRRFIGFSLSAETPSDSSIWRFNEILSKEGLLDDLLIEVNNQLSEKGLIIRQGSVSIIDASVIEAHRCRPKKNDKQAPTQDAEASWNSKKAANGKIKSTYGFKAHLNVDEDGFIKKSDFSTASPHDSNYCEGLLTGKESAVYADSAYKSQKYDALLRRKGIKNRIIRKAYKNRPLTEADEVFNQKHSGVRCVVERTFGVLKNHYGLGKARCVGLSRNRGRFTVMCIAHNIRRGLTIQLESCA